MLHWLYDPKRKIKRFAEENAKPRPVAVEDPLVVHIIDVASNNGMKASDIDSLAGELDPTKLVLPTNNEERFEYLNYLMGMLLDDLNFDSAEKDFLKEMSVEIGLPIEKVPYLIKTIYEGLKTESTLSEIKITFFEILNK